MNDHFLNIRICHIHSVSYLNIEYIQIWQIFNKMSHIEAKSIENWLTYQSEYELMPFPKTYRHADIHVKLFWFISQPIINGFCFKMAHFEGTNMKKFIFEY